ncbi:hypothetical protein [Cellulomonas cellasea]|uniref:Uncharacterized protein n=1 Tax=Cellulomonas cellasea TaxID=43670 RepID=A0A7W4YEG9_9CELL|nr:hypothetical protein [Cellulomonas cellasea]MBB2925571.1 hypothetical protein [Cellulomonas cellasea]
MTRTTNQPDDDVVLPPTCPGAETTRSLRDAPRLAWFIVLGLAHGARKAPTLPARVWAGYIALIAVVFYVPLLLPVRIVQLRDRRAVHYVHRDDRGRVRAVLTVKAKPGPRWEVGDHSTGHPGAGHGRLLRAALLPTLAAAADARGVTIEATAATAALAAAYIAELPGLVDVGHGSPRGRKLRRTS